MSKHTKAPWSWQDAPGAGIQIRGPYKDGTRLLFSDIWRQFPEPEWDAEMVANARLAAAAPELLEALEAALTVIDDYLSYEHNGDPWIEDARTMGEMDINDYESDGRLESARAIIAKATKEPV